MTNGNERSSRRYKAVSFGFDETCHIDASSSYVGDTNKLILQITVVISAKECKKKFSIFLN